MTRALLLTLALAVGGMGCDAAPITGPGPVPTASAPAIIGWDFEMTDLILTRQ